MKNLTFIFFCFFLFPILSIAQLVNSSKAPRKIWAHDFDKPFANSGSTFSKDWPLDIKQTSDGGYIACGYTFEANVDCSNNVIQYVPTIIKLDANGSKQWNFSYLDGGAVYNRQFNKIIELSGNQGYAAVGHVNAGCTLKTFYVHIDLDGSILDQKLIGLAENDNISSRGTSIAEGNGKVYIGGTYTNSGVDDLMLLEADYSGHIISSKTYHPSSYANSKSMELFVAPLWSGGTNPDGSHGSTFQGFALAGTIVNSNSAPNGTLSDNFIDMWVAETNTSGTLIWNTI